MRGALLPAGRLSHRGGRLRLSGDDLGYLACMDRYQQLIEKRDSEGLTGDEADELGRLMSERRGESYEGDAQDPPPDVEMRRKSVPEDEIEEQMAEERPVGPKGTEPNLTSKDPETAPEGGQGPPPA